MKLLRLEANNVFSIDSAKVDLDSRNLVLVTGYSEDEKGSNGAGKSSLISGSIIWGLFGVSTNGIRAEDVVNKNTERKKAWVQIEGIDGLDHRFRITRQRNPNKLKLELSPVPCNQEGDYVDISNRLETETQKDINKIIGRNYSTFTQADFFGQGRLSSFPNLTPKEQREILENILPIDKIECWAENAEQARKSLEKVILKTERELHLNKSLLEEVSSNKDRILQSHKDWEEKKKQDINELELMIKTVQAREDKREETRTEIRTNLESLGEAEDEKVLQQEVVRLQETKLSLDKKWSEMLEISGKWTSYLSSLKVQVKEIKAGFCPTCGQQTEVELTKKLQAQQDTIHADTHKAEAQIELNRDSMDKLSKQIEAEDKRLGDINTHLVVVRQQNTRRQSLEESLASLTHPDHSAQKELLSFSTQLENKKVEENPFSGHLCDADKRLLELGQEKAKLDFNLESLKEDKGPIEVWEGAFKKHFKNSLFVKACAFLNERVKHHLEMINNSQFDVKFTTVRELRSGLSREEFNVHCSSKTGGKNFSSLSGGEKQIVSFAIGMSLAELATTQVESGCNIMILDEPFLYLDPRNCENIVNYLTTELSKSRSTVFLVSNEDALQALVPNRIHVLKEDGVSKVVSV
jgi:DNA repair exonuclease SbcCD ATPase subunit